MLPGGIGFCRLAALEMASFDYISIDTINIAKQERIIQPKAVDKR